MGPAKPIYIRYSFRFLDHQQIDFDMHIDPKSLELIPPPVAPSQAWTALSHEQCPHCPLNGARWPHCPLALNLVEIVNALEGLLSYEDVRLETIVEERHIYQDTTVQQAARSLMGLLIATSGCPHTKFFKPMARFHLPLSTTEETVYRATSAYLLSQYFQMIDGHPTDFNLDGLSHIYEQIRIINVHVANRLRTAIASDPAINAIILLDIFSQSLPMVIEESLESIRYLYNATKQ
jgi:hypothetical protein